ncbi:chitin-inducible gibberellin-responsive protein 1-like [Tasmannia lanceolata]|uniref:chitin-inducible gibberellin-responsive protein 1-like n=1 Tax=Tasmannia lanceolata TaxID=3420 RepID=UPI0040634097
MDSSQHFRYCIPGTDISYEFTPSSTLDNSEWMLGPMKFEIGSSPDSPLSTHFDHDSFSVLSNSREQYSSTENLSGISPSLDFSLETDSSFQRSPINLQEKPQVPYDAVRSMKSTLQELECVLMGPDTNDARTPCSAFSGDQQTETSEQQSKAWGPKSHQEVTLVQPQPSIVGKYNKQGHGVQPDKCQRLINETYSQGTPRGDLKLLLIECARAISENRMDDFEKLIQVARSAVSICGEPIQRLGAYMVEGLVARKEASGTNIYRALRCKEPESKELLSYMHILYEICPYFKFGYMAANGAIAEALRNEDHIHIIDFQIAQGTQWVTLIQALAARPGGAPHVRITGIDDPVSKYARGDGLQVVGKLLAAMSQKFKIPVEFHPLPVFAPDVRREMLDIRPGEALAVNFTLQLHHTPDESVDVSNPRDELLRMVRSLSPKVTTLVEQESNTNTTPFFTRFVETLDYYSAIFESIDVTLPRDNKDRINVEQHCLAKDIVNIIACERKDRVERHELLGKWKSRLTMAGFQPFPLSSYVNSVIRSLLRCYSENYTLVEKDGAMLLGWKDRNLISASAWH